VTPPRELRIPDELGGVRADRVVAVLCEISRAEARRAVDNGRVRLDGAAISASQPLAAGDLIVVELIDPPPLMVPTAVDFDVVYTDDDFLVVAKPAGVVVHPGAGTTEPTLVAGLVHRFPELGELADARWGLVHRLDRDTSGALLVARNAETHKALQDELRARHIARTYLALVHGVPESAKGTIDAPLGRDPHHPTRMALVQGGRPARTHFTLAASWGDAALLEVALETGRTHQIRVHLASIGHAVIGDRTYAGRRAAHRADPGRQWLHAVRIGFVHPTSGQPVAVEADPPPDLMASLAALGPPRAGDTALLRR